MRRLLWPILTLALLLVASADAGYLSCPSGQVETFNAGLTPICSTVPTHQELSSTHSDTTAKTLAGDMTNDAGGVVMVNNAATAWAFYRPGQRTVSGTTDTVLAADRLGVVSYSSTSSVAVTLPQAGAGSPTFAPAGWSTVLEKTGASGTITVTPTTSTINGAATVTLTTQYTAWRIWSDGTNYHAFSWGGSGGSGATVSAQYLQLATDATNSAERVFTPRDNLTATDAGANGAYTLDWQPDPTALWLYDELCGGIQSTATAFTGFGSTGFIHSDLVGTGTTNHGSASGALPNVCTYHTTSGATSGNASVLKMGDAGSNGFENLPDHTSASGIPWEFHVRFKLAATTSEYILWGLYRTDGSNTLPPQDSLAVRYDTGSADTNFMMICARNGGTTTATSLGVAADTNWHRIKISSTVAGTVNFQLYTAAGVAEGSPTSCTSTAVPTADLTMGMIVKTLTAATKDASVDYFSYKRRLAR